MSESVRGGGRVTRRELGKAALASMAAVEALPLAGQQAQPAQTKYTGALDGLEGKVDISAFDPVIFTHQLHDAAPLRMTFQAATRAEAEKWQKALRAKVLELLGGFPAKPSPLQPQTLEVRDFPGYSTRKVRVPEPPRRRRARVPADAQSGQGAARRRDLHSRPRPRSG